VGGKNGLAPGPGLIGQTGNPMQEEAARPLTGIAYRQADDAGGAGQRLTLIEQQEQASAPGQPCLHGSRSLPMFQFGTVFGRQMNGETGLATSHGVLVFMDEEVASGASRPIILNQIRAAAKQLQIQTPFCAGQY
jgi:hypothetical protein